MPKTVTVSYAIQVPDGYELDSACPVHVVDSDALYLSNGAATRGSSLLGEDLFRLRPIPAEKTWERPEWLHKSWKWLLYDAGWRVSSYEQRPDIMRDYRGQSVPLSLAIIAYNGWPDPSDLPPAERIWKIVERGEG